MSWRQGMARKNVTARAERIIRLLPKIMGSIAQWHRDRKAMEISESGRTSRSIGNTKISGFRGSKLTYNQYQALTAIRELGECSVNDLSGKLRIAQSTTSQLVDRLVKAGVATREAFAGDRRRMVVKLSKPGMQMLERQKNTLLQAYTRILLMLDEYDQEMLEDAFEKFYRVAVKLDQSQTKDRA